MRFRVLAAGIIAILLLAAGREIGGTIAYFTYRQDVANNTLATAKKFAPQEASAVAISGGQIVLSWSGASWVTTGYSVTRRLSGGGAFSQVGTTTQPTRTFTDTVANGLVDGSTYEYDIRGVTTRGGTGVTSTIVSARVDNTAPSVTATSPAEAAMNVQVTTGILVTFGEGMNQALTAANFALVPCTDGTSACSTPGTAVSGVTVWQTANKVYFVPNTSLSSSAWYGIKLTSGTGGAADTAGNVLSTAGCLHLSGSVCYRTFQTGANANAAAVSAAAPPNGSTSVGTNAKVVLVFTGVLNGAQQTSIQNGFTLQQTSGVGSPCYVYGGTLCTSPAGGGSFAWSGANGNIMTFTPTNALLAGANYAYGVHVHSADPVDVDFDAVFTAGSGADSTAPSVSFPVPANNATGVDPATMVRLKFSEPMNPGTTASAFTLAPYGAAGAGCTGPAGAAVTGKTTWPDGTSSLLFIPDASLTANTCYQVSVAATATDVAGNTLPAYTAQFTIVNGAAPTVSLANGSPYYSGATVQASGASWGGGGGAGAVSVTWEDGTSLGSITPSGGTFTNAPFNLPASASAGSHDVVFSQASGGTVVKTITVRQPTAVVFNAGQTDVAAGGNTTLTATVYDNGQLAQNAGVAFVKTVDAGGRGSLSASSGTTNGSGQAATTLSVTSGAAYADITVTATSGTPTASVTVVSP